MRTVLALLSCLLLTTVASLATGNPRFPQSVASGDPSSGSVVLWTRVAGLGADGLVSLKISSSGTLALVGSHEELSGTNLWSGGKLTAQTSHDGVVKMVASGLQADTYYYYQFTYNGTRSPIGRTKTAPSASSTRQVKYASIVCNDYVGRYFNVLKHLCEQEADQIDFVLNLGDYIYETTGNPSFQTTSAARSMTLTNPSEAIPLTSASGATYYAAQSVGNYRDIYKTIRQDPQLQRLHELFPMVSVWDDHEFSDDSWKDNATYLNGYTSEQETQRKKNSEQVWLEFIPNKLGLNASSTAVQTGTSNLFPNATLTGAMNFGKNLDLILTDNRSDRPDHIIPEDAFPASIAVDQDGVIAVLAAANGLSASVFQLYAWPSAKASFDAYLDIDASENAVLKATLKGIASAGIGGSTGTAYATSKVSGKLGVLYINAMLDAAGATSLKISDTAAASLPRGISYYLMGKQSFFSEYGSRYQLVNDTFSIYAAYTYQLWIASSGALGRDQAFYTNAQVNALATALGTSAAAQNNWRMVVSSAPFTPIRVNYGTTTSALSSLLPTQGTFGGAPITPGALGMTSFIPDVLKVKYLLNADEVSGFPQFKQGIVNLLAAYNAVIVSGDIHASMFGKLAGSGTLSGTTTDVTGKNVFDVTVPSATSGEFRAAFDGAIATVEGLITSSLRKATGSTAGVFAMNATQKQALVDASDSFIKDVTPEMVDINTKAHGYTVFSAGSTALVAETRTIDTTEVYNNLYSLTPSQLDKKFNRKSFSIAKDTASGLLHSVPVPQFTSGTLATSTQFTSVSYQIIASNSPTTYAATGLPSGLSLNSSTGLISGTATAAGTYSVTLTATNTTGAASKTLLVTVSEPLVRVGETVSLNFGNLKSSATQLALKSGTLLPSGLQFNATTGILSGKVSASVGTYSFDVLEKSGSTTVKTSTIRITVEALPEALSGSFESVLETGKLLTPSGVLRVSLTRLGRWTASLDFAGAFQRSVTGTFGAAPGTTTASININFPAQGNCAAVSTTINLGGELPLISGTYTAGTETGVIRGVRLASAGELPTEECKITGLFDSGDQDGVTYPAGFGWVKGFATRQGGVILTGMLGDSKPVSASLRASASGQTVVWVQPYRSRASYVGGVIDVKNITQTLGSTARLSSGLTWHRQADTADSYAPSSFAAPLQISAWVSRFVPNSSYTGLATALGLTDRLFTLETDGAGLSNATPNLRGLPTKFRLDSGLRLAPLNNATNVQWSGVVNPLDGSFSGALVFPSAARSSVGIRANAYGVLLQDAQAQLDGLVGGGLLRTPLETRAGLFGSAMLQLSK